ncbi:MAG: amidohydrolase, partial [Armatimonadota bacterium]|nr:amidohydrolase [Armatimonadota bacterium]
AARAVDLGGALVIPGCIDAHCHLLQYGESKQQRVDLRGAASLAELQQRLRARLRAHPPAPGGFLLGRGFDQDRLAEARMPTAADLDAVSREVPIVIQRVCGHALVANTRAQELAGVHAPDGFFAEDDMNPLFRAIPPVSFEEKVAAAESACREAAAVGFTGVHCIVSTQEDIAAFRELARRAPLPIHLRLMAGDGALLDPPGATETIPCRTLKLFADGSLGAHTAALSQPYADQPETCGRLLFSTEALHQRIRWAHEHGYQVAAHAIGDAAVAACIEAIAGAQAGMPRPDARHRIEHASVLPPHLLQRLAALGIIAVVQPQFVVSDFWTEARLGAARAAWAYPFRSLLAAGALVAGGTDCPVEALDPFQAIARAVWRTASQHSLTLLEALGIFTRGAAYAGYAEHERGALRPGFWADLLVLPQEADLSNPDGVAALRPLLTLTAGRVVHAAGRFQGLAA